MPDEHDRRRIEVDRADRQLIQQAAAQSASAPSGAAGGVGTQRLPEGILPVTDPRVPRSSIRPEEAEWLDATRLLGVAG